MKKVFLIMAIMMLATMAYAEKGRLMVEPGGNLRFPVFAPDPAYDLLLTPAVTAIPVDGYLAISITSTTDGQMWKSDTNSRAGKVAIPVKANTPLLRGIAAPVKFVIYSGVTGPVERQ
jgi:hypothetical protein